MNPKREFETPVEVGSGAHRYRVAEDWPALPPGFDLIEVAAAAADSRGRVYLFNRGEHPLVVCSPTGELLETWDQLPVQRAHGISIGPDDTVYCVDDFDQSVSILSADGRPVRTLGTSGVRSDTGATSIDYRTIRYAGPPFHFPTNLAVSPEGELYVSDGYGNARIHRFSADGRLLQSWGEPGSGPGQFHVPHGVAVDRHGVVYVADRENDRLQLFSAAGEFLTEWNDLARPCEVFIDEQETVYVAELGYLAGMWPGTTAPSPGSPGGRISILDSRGELLARFGGGANPTAPGDFLAPHDVWVDARGDVYVSEVAASCWEGSPTDRPRYHCIQKFIRVERTVAASIDDFDGRSS